MLYALQAQPDRDSDSRPSDHDSTFHVTELTVLVTQPSMTSNISDKLTCVDIAGYI